MTLLEKAKEIIKAEGKNVSENGIIEYSCPSDYELEEAKNCVREGGKWCEECWNRKMPNTETKEDAYKEDMHTAYNKGMNDAWELAKKLFAEAQECVLDEIFGKSWSYNSIMKLTPQEALAKLKAYEEAQNKIEIGDVIKYAGNKGLVLDCPYNKFLVLTHDGWIQEWYECDVEKTGKHIELDSILEQIGE